MKTVNQIVTEYQNRQETPKYSTVVVVDAKGKSLTFNDVTNLITTHDHHGRWVEFDSVYESVSRHVQIYNGNIIQYIETLPESERTKTPIAKDCVSVTVYTNSGKRESFLDVKNLSENKKSRQVEFDRIVGGDDTHMKMSGVIERFEERTSVVTS